MIAGTSLDLANEAWGQAPTPKHTTLGKFLHMASLKLAKSRVGIRDSAIFQGLQGAAHGLVATVAASNAMQIRHDSAWCDPPK